MKKQKVFTPSEVYQYFQKAYPVLKNVKLRQMRQKMGNIYHGASLLTPKSDQKYKYIGKTRQIQIIPQFIMLNLQQQNSVYVLLHQIAHCLSPQVQRKYDQKWTLDDHSRFFYQKLWGIVKQANQKGLYQKEFDSIQHLMKFDKSV